MHAAGTQVRVRFTVQWDIWYLHLTAIDISARLVRVNNCFAFKVLLYGPSGLELLDLSLSPVNNPNFTICTGVFYRPPSSTHDIFDTLCNSLFCIPPAYFSNFALLGDFNVNLLNSNHPLYDKIDMLCNSFHLLRLLTPPPTYHIVHIHHLLTWFLFLTPHVFHIVTPSHNLQILIIMA